MSPRYSNYVPNNSGLSPSTTAQYTSPGALDYPSNTAGTGASDFSSQDGKRQNYSPVTFQQQQQQQQKLSYQGYQYYTTNYPKSPYNILHTPDSSPTQSPEPKSTQLKQPKSPQDGSKDVSNSTDENTPVLPTPEMSPLEQEKENFQFAEEKRLLQSGSVTNVTAASQNYSRIQNFRQPNAVSYTNSQPITSMPMANGVYVMCANRSSVEQGHVITGTFFPPVATSQDHQLLGVNHTTLNTTATTTTNSMNYFNTNMSQYYHQQQPKEYYKNDDVPMLTTDEQKSSQEAYMNSYKNSLMDGKQEYDLYKNNLAETYSYASSPMVHSYIQHPDERSDVDSDVDAREFDKYLKFTNTPDQSMIDSNHNYHRNDTAMNYHGYQNQQQHPSVILQNTNVVKSEPSQAMVMGHPYGHDVYGTHELSSQTVGQKTDDDFSEILADVRKTCYSNWFQCF